MEYPITVQVVDSVQYLVQKAFNHSLWHSDGFLHSFSRSMEFNDVPQIVLGIVNKEKHLAVIM